MKSHSEAQEIFRLLGLETEEARQSFRSLAELARLGGEVTGQAFIAMDTRNNTATEDGDAELEPAS